MDKEKAILLEKQSLRARYLLDSSALGRMQLKLIDDEIKSQQEKISEMTLSQSRKNENDKLDEQSKAVTESSESAIKKLDTDATNLGVTLDKNLLDVFKKANLETDSIISKFKSIGISVFNEQGKKAIDNPQAINYKANDLSKGINGSSISNNNQSKIEISVPITVVGDPSESALKKLEKTVMNAINKAVGDSEERVYQSNLRYN